MSLTSTLNLGRNALSINQAAIQTTGSNISNVGNPEYTRQRADITTARDQQLRPGVYVGNGPQLDGISRQIDDALEGRLRNSMSEGESAAAQQSWLGRLEATFNELGDADLSTQMSKFFNSWSDLANKPQDAGLRQVVLQTGKSVAGWFRQMDGQIGALRTNLSETIEGKAAQADELATKIANLNTEIVKAEGAGVGAMANGLRDQRDGALKALSGLIDTRTVEQPNGVVNVYVGSEPLVSNGNSRGVKTLLDTDAAGDSVVKVVFKSNNGELDLKSGELGGLLASRRQLDGTATNLSDLAGGLTFELNKIHAGGQGQHGFASVIGTTTVTDTTKALSDPDSGLKQMPANGSFVVHVKDKTTGLTSSTLIKVDLPEGGGGTSTDDLIARIDGVDGVTAVNNGGRLQLTADNAPATEITFSQDTSGALAALGVNNFFTGSDARTIAVNEVLTKDPSLLAAARNGNSGDNQVARAIAGLETAAITALGGGTLKSSYEGMVTEVATASSTASANAEASTAITETLQAQRESLSGVSLDEEAINLMKYQRAFQGAARLVSVVDELMDTMLGMVR
ncbi:MAG TPA: flagellar hook-associated protein FlgK [Tepidisphaeraceae bacterium]|jgi:flagellar hook-associated protein 1 FlgK